MVKKKNQKKTRRSVLWIIIKDLFILGVAFFFLLSGIFLVWASTLKIPDFNSLAQRKTTESTKIYDRTGKILLYDIHEDIKETKVPFSEISRYIKNATVAIEDKDFYTHFGIKPISILRAVLINISKGEYSQGGSTITQQVIKNSLLTPEKKIARKLKEWIVSVKLEQVFTKDEILSLYLNEMPYGGNLYGVEEASLAFFGKQAKDINLHEAAYLAALPQAPTYLSPYGNNRDVLDARKNLVLKQMKSLNFITQKELDSIASTTVSFLPRQSHGIKAPHFVIWVLEELTKIYGERAIQENGYHVITTLDYDLQQKTEEIVTHYGAENEVKYNAKNAGVVGIDPKTGEVLVMVGSRDYFDIENDGNFNTALAQNRQPGSTFKPFVYATAFQKGYTPETILFDLRTQFQTTCDVFGNPLTSENDPSACFMPQNYNSKYTGPITLRNALAQSINVPAVKLLYLTGIKDSLETAKKMGITSLTKPSEYGLTLVLGSGSVSPLEMTNAYSVFANNGVKNTSQNILYIKDENNNTLQTFQGKKNIVLPKNIALQISDILSDNTARTPAFGARSPLYFEGRDVAVKTGTTNNYRDMWTIGYIPSFSLGIWVGNNDNTPMEKKISGFVVAPMWNEIMQNILKKYPDEKFEKPTKTEEIGIVQKPILRGIWKGGNSYFTDKVSGKLATLRTPESLKEEHFITDIHSILYWVNKNDPAGPNPINPNQDSQFRLWEHPVLLWAIQNGYNSSSTQIIPTEFDDVHTEEKSPKINIISPMANAILEKQQQYIIKTDTANSYPITHVDYFINNTFIGTTSKAPFYFSFTPNDIITLRGENTLSAIIYDSVLNKGSNSIMFEISTTTPLVL
ncbi:penicillin-binding protein [Patescibacteria group bacterium]|nr:penicillin-binding protein [Patescibacteria group bacterium]MBU1246679.1 penicillin-binding protein [Patescibacteria group bacterium]MBU1519138.1 penicillin-binding protein [Patescibacteria group bacterium]MBU1730178.1 penicillin-binding protein [Patescibacteria group bacterium]MBU1956639.1 penicillin-binding protein [Patescibacteria group bacterium]